MTITKKDIQYTVGIEDMFICFQTNEGNSTTAPIYEPEVYQQTNITDLTISNTVSNFTKWASNKKIINIVKNSAFGLAFNLAGLDREVKDKMFNKVRVRGFTFDDSKPKSVKKFGVGLVLPQSDGSKLLRWYPNCSAQPSDTTFATQNDEMTINDTAYTITADPLLFNDVTLTELDTGATGAETLTVEDFMKQVIYEQSQIDTLFPVTP